MKKLLFIIVLIWVGLCACAQDSQFLTLPEVTINTSADQVALYKSGAGVRMTIDNLLGPLYDTTDLHLGRIEALEAGGVVSYWTKSSTNLSPLTSGDDILLRDATETLIFGDGDTYIQEAVDDALHFFIGGTSRWSMSNTNINLSLPLTPNGSVAFGGSSAFWTDGFFDRWYVEDLNTSIYLSGSDLTFDDATTGVKTLADLAVTFGAEDQIPTTNAATDDYDYSANFTFDGTDLSVVGNALFGNQSTFVHAGGTYRLQIAATASNNYGDLYLGGNRTDGNAVGEVVFTNLASANATKRIALIGGYNDVSDADAGNIQFYTADEFGNLQRRMTVAADGNVGIGILAPTQELDVEGDASVTRLYVANTSTYIDTTGNNLRFTDATTGAKTLAELAAGGDSASVTYTVDTIKSGDTDALAFYVNGQDRMYIQSSNGVVFRANADPYSNKTFDLGDNTHWWDNVYFDRVYVDVTSNYIDASGSNMTFTDGVTGTKPLAELAGRITINSQTGTDYTLALTDRWNTINMQNTSVDTIIIPLNASVDFDVGDFVYICSDSTGATLIRAASGVAFRNVDGDSIVKASGGWATLVQKAVDKWDFFGGTE